MFARFRRESPERVRASVVRSPDGVAVRIGSREFSIGSKEIANRLEIADFALYGLAAVGMSHDLEIEFDGPVTSSALAQVNAFGAIWALWHTRAPRSLHPLRITASEVVADPPSTGSGGGVLCLSGGVDSTYAARTAPPESRFTCGMLIAGADYASEGDAQFRALELRVGRLAERLGLELRTVATDIRRLKIEYRMLHPLVLAMALHFASDEFSQGGFAADYTARQEHHVHPWGNNSVVAATLATDRFPIFHLGGNAGRSEKVRAIAADERNLMPLLSVCARDISSSGNCGRCEKCVRTKLNLMTGGFDFAAGFVDGTSPLLLLDRLPIDRSHSKLIRAEVALQDIADDLRDEAARAIVLRRLERVRSAHRIRPIERGRLDFR